ncbi:MAG: WecB/TagA/CpsF family glycosyltransferase [Endomicrobiales bacterium]|nr:WecB/TagA/CpsF family glycosyltransferase [Endomicrobiales bacterium]
MSRIPLGPIGLDILEIGSIRNRITEIVNNKAPSQVITLNSLMFNFIYHDPHLLKIASGSALVIPDSVGIVLAARFLLGRKISRIPGIDLIEHLCSLSQDQGYRLFLLGSKQNVIERAKEKLLLKYPSLNIVGTHHGYFSSRGEADIINNIKSLKPDILLVGLDVPYQEVWISSNLKALDVPLVMGVGGSFDVISGKLKRAPLFFQKLGLEWFFRFVQQPWRIMRIRRLPVFILNILKIKFGPSIIGNHKSSLYENR